jgi:hypothetical protein
MNCQRCGREIKQEDSFQLNNRILCEDCYMELGLHPRECDPWETYSATHTPGGTGPRSVLELTDSQKKVLEMIKGSGKLARADLLTNMKLSEADADAIVTTLLRAELAKIISDGNNFYLVPLPYPKTV